MVPIFERDEQRLPGTKLLNDHSIRITEYLHTRLYSSDPRVIRMLSDPVVNRSRILEKTFEAMSSRFLAKHALPRDASALAKLAETLEGRERLIAIVLYRRATQSLCMTVAGLATSALWLW